MSEDLDIPVQDWAQSGEPFRLVAVAVNSADWARHLPADAQSRAARHADGQAGARAGASEWFKTCWLPRELGLRHVDGETGPHGKLRLSGIGAEWGFNLSHAGGYAVAALARGVDIGVDLESTGRKADIERLAARVFSESEQALVRGGGREAFFALWSQKEALLKAIGCGWADGIIQSRTRLELSAFQTEPTTGAKIWSRRILDGAYTLAVATLV